MTEPQSIEEYRNDPLEHSADAHLASERYSDAYQHCRQRED
ncbi:hypothetical protein [Lacipirellula sp.]